MNVILFLCFGTILTKSLSETPMIHPLTSNEFGSKVKNSKSSHLIFFYSPTCPHCAKFAPEFEMMRSSVRPNDPALWKIDCVAERPLCVSLKVKKVPTVFFVVDQKVYVFNEDRTYKRLGMFVDHGYKLHKPIDWHEEVPTFWQKFYQGTQDVFTLIPSIFQRESLLPKVGILSVFFIVIAYIIFNTSNFLRRLNPLVETPKVKPE